VAKAKARGKDTEEIRPKSKPFIDIKEQAALGAEVPPARDVAREVFEMLSETADALREKGRKRGALIVIGNFSSIGEVKGARSRPPNPFEGLYLSARDKAFQSMLLQDPALEDGAVVVDTSGPALGGRIYFFVENADNVEIPEGCRPRLSRRQGRRGIRSRRRGGRGRGEGGRCRGEGGPSEEEEAKEAEEGRYVQPQEAQDLKRPARRGRRPC